MSHYTTGGATTARTAGSAETVLAVDDVSVSFRTEDGTVRAVRGVSYDLHRGEVLGIVGESGSGKSVTSLAVMGLLPRTAHVTGSVRLGNDELLGLSEHQLAHYRGQQLAMIFQDPMTSLNPVYSVGWQIAEALTAHQHLSREAANARAVALLKIVGIPNAEERAHSYPHEFSGGMRQRAVIAIAIANGPEVIIADEPTTALDVTVQAQVLETLKTARDETGAAMILITHDLGVVAGQADRVLVMYAGRAVEVGTVEEIFYTPRMPYTLGLLGSLPRLDRSAHAKLTPITGVPPSLIDMPPGCPFAPRCPMAEDICRVEEPMLAPTSSADHVAACHFSDRLEGMEPGDLFKTTSKDDALPAEVGAAVPLPGDAS